MAQHDRFTISAADHGVDHITQCEFHLGVGMIGRAVLGVSLDIGNYCTLRLFFNQAQLLYSGSKCDKSGKYYI
ncbi:hypothetical protein, partial [Klebsiella pneumoniae]|uniref:hypothetical protein n=1 Tax=Klebsiella pneumoniae TaxID=573 RepID=UPI003F7949D9